MTVEMLCPRCGDSHLQATLKSNGADLEECRRCGRPAETVEQQRVAEEDWWRINDDLLDELEGERRS